MNQFQPFFSIIIPTCNRHKQLAVCLQSLAHLKYPRDSFEVIVVDDDSDISVEIVAEPFHKQFEMTLLKQKSAGPAAARNTGARHARGDFLAFIDDDCTPNKNWLNVFAKQFDTMPDSLIGGKIIYNLSDNVYAATSQIILDIVYENYNRDHSHARFFSACNMAAPARLFLEIGGFNQDFRTSEDREFCDRWFASKYHMIFSPEAIVYHNDYVNSFRSYCKRYFDYGRGAFRYHHILSVRGSGYMQGVLKFYKTLRNWLLYSFEKERCGRAIVSAYLLIVWQVSNAVGFLWEAISQKFKFNEKRTSNRKHIS